MPRPEVHRAALSLGGNTGDVAAAFAQALAALETGGARVIARSSLWRTPPWGKTDQPDFLNMAALVETALAPEALLDLCLNIERTAGRERTERWGPRPLDIDIIVYDDVTMTSERLSLPHPRASERAFVLIPLAEIAPDMMLGSESVSDLARTCDASGNIRDDAASTRLARDFQD